MSNSFDGQLKDLKKSGETVRILQPAEVQRFQAATWYKEVRATWVEKLKG